MLDLLQTTVCEPDLAEWNVLLSENRERLARAEILLPHAERRVLRRQVVAAAVHYTRSLAANAGELRLAADDSEVVVNAEDDQPLAAAGHQPLIYHPGLLYKNLLLEQFGQQAGIQGLNIIVDTDVGSAAQFACPQAASAGAALRAVDMSTTGSSTPMLFQTLAEESQLRSELAQVEQNLRSVGLSAAAERAAAAGAVYAGCAGSSVVDTNTMVRRACENSPRYLDLPLSTLLRIPETVKLFALILSQGPDFAAAYNKNLNGFRAEHRISNRANPFPNLELSGERVEMPFWLINLEERTRAPLSIERKGAVCVLYAGTELAAQYEVEHPQQLAAALTPRYLLAPRAMMLTFLLRCFVSDLFIHGTGGARYDACTDAFLQNYFGLQPPHFITATATAYLFQAQAAEYQRVAEWSEKRRELYFQPERFFEAGLFGAEEQAQLQRLSADRRTLVAWIKAGKAGGESTKELTAEIKAVDAQVRQVVDAALAGYSTLLGEEAAALRNVYLNREYPIFFFVSPCGQL